MGTINSLGHIGQNIKYYRNLRKISQNELANRLGYKDRSTISKIEKGVIHLNADKLIEVASILGITYAELIGAEKIESETVKIPVLGRVAAGIPIMANEEIIEWEDVPVSMQIEEDLFGLKIKGDSMSPRIQDGDTVIVRKQAYADDGDVVIVLINGEEGTCKKIKRSPEGLTLISYNPNYPPLFFTNKEIKNLPVTVLGKVVELRAKI